MVLNLSIKFEINLTTSKYVIANPQNPHKFDIFHPKNDICIYNLHQLNLHWDLHHII